MSKLEIKIRIILISHEYGITEYYYGDSRPISYNKGLPVRKKW